MGVLATSRPTWAGVGTATARCDALQYIRVIAKPVRQSVRRERLLPGTPAAQPADICGRGLRIEPAVEKLWGPLPFVTRTGNTVTVVATIENVGDEPGTYTAELLLNNEVVGSQDVSLAAGEKKQVRFVMSGVSAGSYDVRIGELSGTFTSTREVTWCVIAVGVRSCRGCVFSVGSSDASARKSKSRRESLE
jgi:hypothetical protein